jgi:hypothetical protein
MVTWVYNTDSIWRGSVSKTLNEVESKEKYCVEVSNRYAAFEDLDAEVDINSAW